MAASTTPIPARTTKAMISRALRPDIRRREGRCCCCGRSHARAAAGSAGAAEVWGEEFMVGLPFIVRHDTHVAIEDHPLRDVGYPVRDQLILRPEHPGL